MLKICAIIVVVSSMLSVGCGRVDSSSAPQQQDNTDHVTSIILVQALELLIARDAKVQAGTATDKEYAESVAGFVDLPKLETYQAFKQAKVSESFTGTFADWVK